MTIPRRRSFGTGWYYRNPSYSLYPNKTKQAKGKRTKHYGSATTAAADSEMGGTERSDSVTSDTQAIRASRLAVLFAVLFLITLLVAISSVFGPVRECPKASPPLPTPTIPPRFNAGDEHLCMNEECIRLAANYLNNMNTEISPCTDFYEFACGQYASARVIPEHERKVTVLTEMKSRLDRHLKDILEKSARENASAAMRLAQIYYDSCMDEETQDEQDLLPLSEILSKLGGWQLLTNARFEQLNFHWETLAGQTALYGVGNLVRFFVHNSFSDSNQHMLMFSPPKLLLEKKKFYKEPLETNKYLQFYKQYMLDLMELLGAEVEAIEPHVNDILYFETQIANLTRSESIRNHSAINNVMTLGDFRARYEKINWDLLFNDDIRSYLAPINDAMLVNVLDIGYFDRLAQLIGETRIQIISDYMMWKVVSTFDSFLPRKYREPFDRFKVRVMGSSEVPRWEACVHQTREKLGVPLSTAYAHKHFDLDHSLTAEELIADLKESMRQTLLNTDWMDDETRNAALHKLQKMGHKIGYPKMLLNETAVLMPFAGIRLSADRYFENAVALKRVEVREILRRLHKPSDKSEWVSPVIAVDAYHYFNGNEIIFPAGILQFPMFVPLAPTYINYGAIGMGIGHEITHGYDDLGAQYDEEGNLRRWWLPETMRVFQSKKQCFVQQYNNKFEPTTERKLDGRLTIGENIADNGGLRVAHRAYELHQQRVSDHRQLPGLQNFTSSQMFFLAFANTWCEAVKPSAIDYIMETDVHSLGMFRVNVPLQNFPAFSQAFNCPIGSPMNPFEKCRVW
ncbi:unnamed protein product, partial [Mesorhabditis belari]|uniref:Uncharacterized protein n=1 Tax=Mesorhabditis belari TaxID=2138241 RepID=A0AAF3J6H0_9BILA